MPSIIQRLPDALANQIAAGEVIQRPASVVKELMENAVDAGADAIELVVEQAGKSLIRVIDNGIGMTAEDARMAFEKHATSKIRTVDDLFDIRTKGFRGEALASMAAIAHVEVKTRQEGDELGTEVRVAGSEISGVEPCQTPVGTSVAVKNLFFNVPARRQFLKTDNVETKHIVDEFTRVALAHPEIGFQLTHNGNELYRLRPGNRRQRIVGVLGDAVNDRLVPVSEETDHLRVDGFVGKPEFARKTRGEQYLFANNRFIRSNYLNHAIYKAYKDMIPSDRYPLFVLFLEVDPERIDVNVHPTKQEVKFEDEKLIYSVVNAAVRHALARFSITPSLDFDAESGFDNALTSMSGPPKDFDPSHSALNRASTDFPFSGQQRPRPADSGVERWQELYEIARKDSQARFTIPSTDEAGDRLFDNATERRPVQLHGRYILSVIRSGFVLIDQRSAHERILFERFLERLTSDQAAPQQQLFPQTIELAPADAELLNGVLDDVRTLGFDISAFGGTTFVVNGLPADLDLEGASWVEELLDGVRAADSVGGLDARERVAWAMARSTAVRRGKSLSAEEMGRLTDELFACSNPYTTPAGRKTIATFTLGDLDRRFAKTP